MMNSVNVSVANAVINAPGTTTTIMKSTSSSNSASGSQPTISLQPNVTGGIIPGTIIATTNSQQQSANHDPQLQSVVGNQQPSVTTFTIHAPTQPLTNNHLTVCSAASTVTQMQSINANSSIIHQSNIGVSTPSVVTTILPSATGPQVTIPLNVTSVPTVLKPQASVALPIGQRFQSMTSVTGPNGQPSGQINTLFIHHDPLNVGKAPTIAHSSSSSGVHQQQPTHGPSQSVINATVSIPGSTVTIPAAHSNQSNSVSGGSSGGGTPLFIQTNNHQQHSSNATNILHSVATATAQAQAAAAQVTNLSATINLSTSAHSTVHQQQQQQQQFQRLKVEDALSYLDQVKFKFNDQPQVYNDFLDIMKEFKSQSIDTPGVIQRVSNLFKGHPELIVGFNTFLPPGYKIEIHANDQVNVSMPNSTNVVLMSTNPMLPSQPTGVATSTIVTGPGIHAQQQTMTGNLSRNSIVPPPPPSSSSSQVATSGVALHTAPPQQQSQSASHNQNLVAQTYSNSIVGSNRSDHSNATSLNLTRVETINNTMGRVDVTRSQHVQPSSITQPPGSSPIGTSGAGTPQPVEFNHAINYVNKIKNRFQHQPEVYKQFLDILQNYQKDQRSKDGIPCTMASGQKFLTETEVFTKVAKLFQNQDDLLQEFSQFLPDANGNSSASIGGTHGQSTTLLSMSQPNIPISSVPNPGQLTSYNLVSGPSTGGSVAAAAAAQSAVNYSQPMVDSIVGSQYVSVNSIGNDGSSSTSSNVQMMKKPLNMTSSGSIHSGGSRQASNVNSSPTGYHNQPNAQQSAHSHRMPKRQLGNGSLSNISGHHGESSNAQHPPPKRSKQTLIHETDGSKYMGELSEYAFFDKLKAALNHPIGYSNFLKSLNLYTNQTINQSELFQLITPIFHRLPDLFKRFKDILGSNQSHHHKDYHQSSHHFYGSDFHHNSSGAGYYSNSYSNQTSQLEGLSHRVAMMKDRSLDNDYVELDFNQCKRYGLSYRTIPKNSARQECSGRTQLCHEVLNDTLVSFPSWSEDSTFVSSRKTTYEEHIYRTEDERYELDHVIETNFATIKLFAALMRKMDLMSSEEKNNFRLDDYLGGTSKVIHQKAVRRIYGDKAQGIIDALKFAPARSIPVVYNRLVYKDEEWREAQKQFNKSWRDQLEKYYLKSLDHQGINFKPNDIKNFRSKTLLNEIENIFDERSDNQANEQQQQQQQELQQTQSQPHLTYTYTDKTMIEVACNLIIHHVKRQTSIHVDDKKKIKSMMLLFIPDFFGTSLGDLSDDEIDDDEGRTSDHRQDEANTPKQGDSNSEQASDFDSISESISVSSSDSDSNCSEGVDDSANSETDSNWGSDDSSDEEMIIDDEPDKDGKVKDEEDSTATTKIENEKDKTDSSVSMAPKDYTLFFANEFWYYFFRLHHTLCERLSRMHKHSLEIAAEEASQKHARDNSPASQLGYRTNFGFNVEDYFTALIDMVKQLLDGNLDSNQYEDTLREMFGINAYICFTFDKLVTAIVRQLQHIVADEVSQHCADMCIDAQMSENVRRTYAASNFRRIEEEAVYQRQSEQMMSEEHCFKIIIYPCGKITFELLASEEEESESESEEDEESNSTQSSRTLRSSGKIGTNSEVGNKKWADVDDDDDDDRSSVDRVKIDDDLLERLELNPLFLKRCVRNYKSQANISKTTKTSLQVPNNNNNKNNISQDQDDKDKEQSSTTLNEDSNSNRKFSNQDKSQNECQLSFKNFNSVVLHDDFSLCRRDSIIKARESHKKVSEHKKRKFAKWYQEFTISHLNIED